MAGGNPAHELYEIFRFEIYASFCIVDESWYNSQILMRKFELYPFKFNYMEMELNSQDLRPLTQENIEEVYHLFKKNEEFFLITRNDFENQTLGDFSFNPELSLVYYPSKSEKPIAIIVGVVKKGYIKKNLIIKVLVVDSSQRHRGIGTWMFKELIKRSKPYLNVISSVVYGFSPPQFLQPGVDVRHTSLLYFLQSMGLKRRHIRQNLTIRIPNNFPKPKSEKHGHTFHRITSEYYESTIEFVKKSFIAPTWSDEVKLTLHTDTPTTFIALDPQKNVVGFASHSTCFAGSFGPTGVMKSLRGKGLGGELLKWCIWDIKNQGLDICTIMYVVGDTVKYYSKTVGAYVHPVYIPMSRSILKWWNVR